MDINSKLKTYSELNDIQRIDRSIREAFERYYHYENNCNTDQELIKEKEMFINNINLNSKKLEYIIKNDKINNLKNHQNLNVDSQVYL